MSSLSHPPIRSPFVDSRGYVTSPWVQWLESLHVRVGGDTVLTIKEVASSAFDDAGIAEQAAQIYQIENSLQQGMPVQPFVQPYDNSQDPPSSQSNTDQLTDPPSAGFLLPNEQLLMALDGLTRPLYEQIAVLSKQINDIKQGLSQ